jgi:hypothetical protein
VKFGGELGELNKGRVREAIFLSDFTFMVKKTAPSHYNISFEAVFGVNI